MKKLLLITVLFFSIAGVFAQTATELKNTGNAAARAKDYKTALDNYEKFLQAPDTFEDAALVFNSGYCASKLKDYAKAVKYFDLSIQKKYKLSSSFRFKAIALKKMKNLDEMIATLKEGIKNCPTKSSKLEYLLGKEYLLIGQKQMKAKKFDDAIEAYTLASQLKSKKNKINAFLSLGTLHYNQGAGVMQAATPIANSKPDEYKAETDKAQKLFRTAMDYLKKASALDSANKNVITMTKQVQGVIK